MKEKKVTKKRGRPTKLNAQQIKLACEFYRLGKTDHEVADLLGICYKTIFNWKAKSKDFLHTQKSAKALADDKIEKSLYERAQAEEYEEVTREYDSEGNLKSEKRVMKKIQPDTTAQIFWLKNRRPEEWRDRQLLDVSLKDYLHPELAELPTEDLKAILTRRGE